MEQMPIDALGRGSKNWLRLRGFLNGHRRMPILLIDQQDFEMSRENTFEELSLDHPLLTLAAGGEVGATGMGDNWSYTGEPQFEPKGPESFFQCSMAEMTGRNGYKTMLQAFAACW